MNQFPDIVNVSLPKTGSTTIASLFAKFDGVHEGLHIKTTKFLMNQNSKEPKINCYKEFLFKRQQKLNARVDSATFMHFFLPDLLDIWPESTYLHVVRDPIEWTISYLYMLTQFSIQLSTNTNTALWDWSNNYLDYQFSGIRFSSFQLALHDPQFLVRLIDKMLIYWHDRTVKTQLSLSLSSSFSITTTLPKLSDLASHLAICANIDPQLLPSLKKRNAAQKDSKIYPLLQKSVYDNSSGLSSFKQSLFLFDQISRNSI